MGVGEPRGTRALYAAIPLAAVGLVLAYTGGRGETDANG
jgi:hypothetical protein